MQHSGSSGSRRIQRQQKRTVSTRVVMFMTLFNGFTVEGEFMASAASYMFTTPLALEAAWGENDEFLVKNKAAGKAYNKLGVRRLRQRYCVCMVVRG